MRQNISFTKEGKALRHSYDGTVLEHLEDGKVKVHAKGYAYNEAALQRAHKENLIVPPPPAKATLKESNLSKGMRKKVNAAKSELEAAEAVQKEAAEVAKKTEAMAERATEAKNMVAADVTEMGQTKRPGIIGRWRDWIKNRMEGPTTIGLVERDAAGKAVEETVDGVNRVKMADKHAVIRERYDGTQLAHHANGEVSVVAKGYDYSPDALHNIYGEKFVERAKPAAATPKPLVSHTVAIGAPEPIANGETSHVDRLDARTDGKASAKKYVRPDASGRNGQANKPVHNGERQWVDVASDRDFGRPLIITP